MPSEYVFEVVDASDEEVFYPLGVFREFADARLAMSWKTPADLCDEVPEQYAIIEVRRRKIGWSGMGRTVLRIEWAKVYCEAKDEYKWEVTRTITAESLRCGLERLRATGGSCLAIEE